MRVKRTTAVAIIATFFGLVIGYVVGIIVGGGKW